jgi:alpha-L-rhamnosidase
MQRRFDLHRHAVVQCLLAVGLIVGVSAAVAAGLVPNDLRCEYLRHPQGVDVLKPRFFWVDRSTTRGLRQTGWQIQLKRQDRMIWDSGKVLSDESIQIEYAGPPLESTATYRWRVRIWDQAGGPSAWSEESEFSTGLFRAQEWQAKWIARWSENEWTQRYQASREAERQSPDAWGDFTRCPRDPAKWAFSHPKPYEPCPLLRKEFTLGKPVKEALLHVTGLGNYQLFLNGQRIDNGALAPGMTDYTKQVLYNTYELASRLRPGNNTLGLVLGNGWYNELCPDLWGFWKAPWVAQPKAIAQLRVTFADDSQVSIATDETWKVRESPILFSDFRIGDVYDATREIPGWCEPGFDASAWVQAAVVPGPLGRLKAELLEPIRPCAEFRPDDVSTMGRSRMVEVTKQVADLLTTNGLVVPVNNGLSQGDPAPGVLKTLRVEYTREGAKGMATAREGTTLRLPADGAKMAISRATYGEDTSGTWLFSFPQNLACQLRFKVAATGLRGKPLKFTFYTYRDSQGRLLTPSGPSYSYYVCKGEKEEVIQLPQFGYAGGRYVTVEGLENAPSKDAMTLVELRSAVEDAGALETSDPLLDRLQQNVRWTQANALHSFPQDCWTREKLGWTGDAHLTAEEAMFNFGMGALYTKWMRDHLDVQGADGGLAPFIPNFRSGNEGLTWSSSGIIIPWELYRYYGDKRILEQMRESGARYLEAAPTLAGKPRIYFGGPAEWCVPWAKTIDQIDERNADLAVPYSTFPGGGEGHCVYGTAYYYRLAGILEETARVLGRPEDAQRWRDRREQVGRAFHREFFDPAHRIYHGENPTDYRQAANVIPLWFGMVPEEFRESVIANLVGDIVARQEGHLNTAVTGTQALFEELPRLGQADLAYEMAMQKSYPGYLWPIVHFGLTSLPEHWEGFGTHEHPFFGSVGAFFYKWLGGIQPDEQAPGFKHFWIRPSIDNPLEHFKASYRSVRGLIRSEWRKSGSSLSLEVEVPANAEADVEVPKFGYASPQIEEGGAVVWTEGRDRERTGILAATEIPQAIRFRVAGGTYRFQVTSEEPLARARSEGIGIRVADATGYPGETLEIPVQATGNIKEAKLEVRAVGGIRVIDVAPTSPTAWKVALAVDAAHAPWRVEPLNLVLIGVANGRKLEVQKQVRLAVRGVVEVRYPRADLCVAAAYDKPQTLFHLRNRRGEPTAVSFAGRVPGGWGISFKAGDRTLGPGESVSLAPRLFHRVQAILRPPAYSGGAEPVSVGVIVLEKGKRVGEFQCPALPLAEKFVDSFQDDFKTLAWKTEGQLKLERTAGGAEISTGVGRVDAMVSDWMVMDCSKPLKCVVKTSSVAGEWCLQLEDGKRTHYLIGDTRHVGTMEGDFAQLNLDGLQRFRLRFLAIGRGGDCRIGLQEVSVVPKAAR